MKIPLASIAALVVVGASCVHGASAAGRVEGGLRVATWNILYLNRDLDRVAADIAASGADVVLLQEVTPEAAERLDGALAERYPERRFDGEYGLLSRRELAWSLYVPPEHRRRGVQIAAIQAGSGGRRPTVLVANVHLEAQVLDDPLPHGVIRSLDRAEATHVDELKMLVRRLDPRFPHVIAGDFNSLPLYASRTFLKKNGYLDAADAASLWPDTTWADAIFGIPTRIRIDYVYVKGGLTPKATGILESSASDHHLLWVDLHLPEAASDVEFSHDKRATGR